MVVFVLYGVPYVFILFIVGSLSCGINGETFGDTPDTRRGDMKNTKLKTKRKGIVDFEHVFCVYKSI